MKEFVDTFAFFAWLNPRDAAYEIVNDYMIAYRGRFVTTEWILVELADGFSSPANREGVARFLRRLRSSPRFEIVDYSQEALNAGLNLFEARRDKSWSLTDCISFEIMTACGITRALTADRHFEQAGFEAAFRI